MYFLIISYYNLWSKHFNWPIGITMVSRHHHIYFSLKDWTFYKAYISIVGHSRYVRNNLYTISFSYRATTYLYNEIKQERFPSFYNYLTVKVVIGLFLDRYPISGQCYLDDA